jgi:hypothetical protein
MKPSPKQGLKSCSHGETSGRHPLGDAIRLGSSRQGKTVVKPPSRNKHPKSLEMSRVKTAHQCSTKIPIKSKLIPTGFDIRHGCQLYSHACSRLPESLSE